MPQTKIILDSTCYFRLAQNIHPLLGVPFGKGNYALYAHEKLVAEFNKQPRLQTKFDWFLQNDYVQNRRLSISPGRKGQAAIDATYGYMWPEAQAMFPLISPTDVRILATAAELGYRMVTDDQDLYKLAEMYGVHVTSSLELMRLMLDEGHINMDKVEQVVAQWEYDEDKPANFRNSYIKQFGRTPPKA
jgi:hypothetical protein